MQKEIIDQPKVSIFDFTDFRAYLIKVGMPDGLYAHTGNNLKAWAQRLGYKSPSSLTMVMRGQRLPSFDMITALVQDLGMNSRERKYFELLVKLEKFKRKKQDPQEIMEQLAKLNTDQSKHSVGLKEFSLISEWYFLAIKQLIETPNFIEDEDWIYKKLRKKLTPSQIKRALSTLAELGITGRDDNGKLIVVTKGLITSNDVPSSAIKRHHYGMINRALEAIDEQDVSERQINSVTMKIKKKDIEDAKKSIFDFIKEFNNKFAVDDADDIYQLNIQMFKHTKDMSLQ
ncbi:MAG: hypothetical protein BM556_16065 [Bacteriovorax sp. MedPE-SWde]|nr:MAG: hypothetical protein BM556_16065 [Bacteriovorax sp. MedPE-SWde]